MNLQYRSLQDMSSLIISQLYKIPPDVDLIVGIPRSGLLAANILALHLNLPLTDLDSFLSGRILGIGSTRRHRKQVDRIQECRKIAIVDDSVWTGKSMEIAKQKVKNANISQPLIYAAIYAGPDSKDNVDLYFEVCPFPRLFEWNMMHHTYLSNACLSLEGVLCQEPTLELEKNDRDDNYINYLTTAKPLLLPTIPVGYIVTSRLEKYRNYTEDWLKEYGVTYKQLIMQDLSSIDARLTFNLPGTFKAKVYQQIGAALFIENHLDRAIKIANKASKPVLCLENRQLILPSQTSRRRAKIQKAIGALEQKLRAALKRTFKLTAGKKFS
ncbi:MAG: hypothetical protein KME17_03445 [Cyanosarcina radialis HA8281-LM2]|jgi:uncharacterized HAD superfamily protein/adenine/guanine phosphoribosyltransferase-like PRPP-binding protein|nr:hypothetical protein [Cyanosarcina radialis HA8281-LM2]